MMLRKETYRMASRVLRPSVPLHRLAVPAATRGLATPAGQHKSQSRPTPTNAKDARGETPVDDIDLVFDYPSEGQGSYQKQSLEASGLDLHSAMPHHPKQQGQGHGPGAGGRGGQQRVGLGNGLGWLVSGVFFRFVAGTFPPPPPPFGLCVIG